MPRRRTPGDDEDLMTATDTRAGHQQWLPTTSSGRRQGRGGLRRRSRSGLLAAAVALMGAGLTLLAPAADAAACSPDPLVCPQRIYVGASVESLPGDPAGLDPFAEATGVSPSSALFFLDFGGRVDTGALQRLSAGGGRPWRPGRPRARGKASAKGAAADADLGAVDPHHALRQPVPADRHRGREVRLLP